jgi:hypothetical protein
MKKVIRFALLAGFVVAVLLGMTGCFLFNGSSPVPSYGAAEEAFEAMGYTTMLPTWWPDDLEQGNIEVWDGLGISYRNSEGNKSFHFSAKQTEITAPDPTDSDEEYEFAEEYDKGDHSVAIEWHPGFEEYRAYWHQDGVLYEIDTSYGFSIEDLRSVIEGVQ